MVSAIYERMDVHNQKFDEGIAKGNDPKVEMERIVTSIFKRTTQVVEAYAGDLSKELRLETTKAIARVTANTLTAAAVYPQELGGFVDEHIQQNVQQYDEIVEDFHKEVARARGEDIEERPEKVFGDNNPFVENDVNKSAQVSAQPKQDVPNLNK
jgi:hypothetical protein